jgi:hypothetical protein
MNPACLPTAALDKWCCMSTVGDAERLECRRLTSLLAGAPRNICDYDPTCTSCKGFLSLRNRFWPWRLGGIFEGVRSSIAHSTDSA